MKKITNISSGSIKILVKQGVTFDIASNSFIYSEEPNLTPTIRVYAKKNLLKVEDIEKGGSSTVSREQGEEMNLKEFEKNNMDSNPTCGCDDDDAFEMVDKNAPQGQIKSLATYKIAKTDLQENKAYVLDHFTKKLIQNPKFDSSK